MAKKIFFTLIVFAIAIVFLNFNVNSNIKPDSLSRATPKALNKKFPSGISLKITGKVKNDYVLTNKDLAKYATVRFRTREVLENGELNGAYIYHGIPVFSIIEGIAPEKSDQDLFDRPLDLIIVFKAASGEEIYFSYGELAICDDNDPVILAFLREEVLPAKDPEKYTKNRDKGDIKGLKLVCPGDFYTERYLDDVVSIELRTVKVSTNLLPATKKGLKCNSEGLFAVENNHQKKFILDNPVIIKQSNWFKIGHGRGIKGEKPAKVEGLLLSDLLKKNFTDCGKKDFFLFVACDGYRVLISGYELFYTKKGKSFMLIQKQNGEKLKNGFTLGLLSDYFVDRDVREVSHIERIKKY